MKKKIYLPKSFEELKSLNTKDKTMLWSRYFKNLPATPGVRTTRMLWYKIQCENQNIQVKQKHISKLNKYATDPNGFIKKAFKKRYHLRSGMEIIKKYKGKEYKVIVRSEKEFVYNDRIYSSLSATAKAICDHKVSGNNFFGLNNKHPHNSIMEASE